ncbi:MAG: putative Ig domain-containing protein [Verrucomicrobiales bacterium]|nr:putative Ig domain-containing protein [Verrucomicrobiales bacterium]
MNMTPSPTQGAASRRRRPSTWCWVSLLAALLGLPVSNSGAAEVDPAEDSGILTPPAPATPRLQGPRVTGVRKGSPFLHRVPATGERPMTFSAVGLPAGLGLDPKTGIITGRVDQEGTSVVTLTAVNAQGRDSRTLRIVVGTTLALTPPMGWNSWYIHYDRVSDRIMREAADQMVATGMADYGYEYVNIDDCWMVKVDSKDPELGGEVRDADGRLRPNRRFPDMRAMTEYIHARGLKAGLYTSPGPKTCAGFAGSYGHEALDARTFADWGFDFLKYDWCSYTEKAGGKELEHMVKPYRLIWSELQKQSRDIVHNLCQYGMADVWTWGGTVGNCWRTTGDLGLENAGRLPAFYSIGLSNARHAEHAKPGGWNDPDYILIGWVGNAHKMGEGTRTTLTPLEQYSYMSMWSLMAAPLIFSGDMARLDAFTLNILCNHEVIDLNQDPLGRQARIVRKSEQELVMVKELEDGSRGIGLFNLGEAPASVKVSWAEAGLSGGRYAIRDVWRQKDLVESESGFESRIGRHGVRLVRVRAAGRP